MKRLKCVGGSKSKTTVPFVPRKTKAGAKLGCAKVAVFPNEAYAVCGLSAAAKGREMTQQKSVCHTKSKITGSIVSRKASSMPKVPECVGVAVFPNVTYEQVWYSDEVLSLCCCCSVTLSYEGVYSTSSNKLTKTQC